MDLHKPAEALNDEVVRLRAVNSQLQKALKPFAEVYGRSSKLIHESRGMSSVPLSHRVVLLSEQSDGSFGYLSIRTFRAARAALDAIKEVRK